MQLTRRYFLQSSGLLAAYTGVSPFTVLARGARPLPSVLATHPKRAPLSPKT